FPWALLLAAAAVSCSTAPPRAPVAQAPAAPPPAPALRAPSRPAPAIALALSPLTPDQQILHALNRVGYGPRPRDLEPVRQVGLATYLGRQLDPASIAAPRVEQALGQYPTLAMSSAALAAAYPRPSPEAQRKVADGEMSRAELAATFPPERRPYRVVAELQA